jgi:hypothetical protein
VFGLVSAFTALELAGDYGAYGLFYPDPIWLPVFLASLAGFLVLVALKKGGLLDVEGR